MGAPVILACVCEGQEVMLVDLAPAHLRCDAAVREDDDPVGDLHELLGLGRRDHHGAATCRDLIQGPVQIAPGADVDALGRLVKQ
jgi:hypothetical protein